MTKLGWLLCVTWLGLGPAWASDAERALIDTQKSALKERLVGEERACSTRFLATACVADARARHREALAPWRERELQIDDASRKQRAAERSTALADRQQAIAAKATAAPAAASAPGARQRPASRSAPRAATASSAAERAGGTEGQPSRPAQSAAAARETKAAERAQAARKRQSEAEAAQARIARREEQARAQGQRRAPLPSPDAAR